MKIFDGTGKAESLISFPTWDGKLVLAGIFIIGYYGMVYTLAQRGLPTENKEIIRDAMLTLGPPIGVIVGALFRSTGAEERREALRSTELQTAITTPSTMAPATDVGENVESGARKGAREGVTQGLDAAGATSGERDPWDSSHE
jgi:hypothetical protein